MTAEVDDMPGARRRWRRVALGLGGMLSVIAALLWIERRPIAAGFVNRALASRGVAARYRIAEIGFNRQRLTNLAIGDSSHPDLVADWVEVETSVDFSGPRVTGIRAGQVRLRGRTVNGRLSLGAVDKLTPPPSGKPFALPALVVDVTDARLRLETPQGVIGIKLSGSGRLDDGFSGRLAAVSESMATGGCQASRLAAILSVDIAGARPHLRGPVRAAGVDCGAFRALGATADIDATLSAPLDRWRGDARLRLGSIRSASGVIEQLGGTIDFNGSAVATSGVARLHVDMLAGRDGLARGVMVSGGYRVGSAGMRFSGRAGAEKVRAGADWLRRLAAIEKAGSGTPLAPLAARFAAAAGRAARDFSVSGDVSVEVAAKTGRMTVRQLTAESTSGGRLLLNGGEGVSYGWPGGAVAVDGLLSLAGGGLPDAAIRIAKTGDNAAIRGTGFVLPYRAGDAQLAATGLGFSVRADGTARFAARVTLSGRLPGGRIDNVRLPVTGLVDRSGRVVVNRQCAPLAFDRLRISGLDVGPSGLMLCPRGTALADYRAGRIGGGAVVIGPVLKGTLGGSPVTLAAARADLNLADSRFALADVAARLGAADRQTRLDIARLDGRYAHGLGGRFAGAGGQIGNVPLLLSDATGDWTLNDGRLALRGALTVADADRAPRFKPLAGLGVTLALEDNRIAASGALVNPASGVKVSDVTLAHDLGSGEGSADLIVSGIRFDDKFQPDQLTRLTYGVIADVAGTVNGEGHIRWNRDGVISDGVFRTKDTRLAAAFGPVTGLSTEIRFTDLLGLVSAPGQVATVATINPGIAVEDGVVRYATLSNQRLAVEGAHWPFAGGDLILEPTVLDFAEEKKRRMTFRVKAMDAAQFLQQFDFKNLNATGTFDGVLPMVFDSTGGRIDDGHLIVREGGGTIAYVGELTQKDLGFWGNMAFQSLKSLRYRKLDIVMNGPLAGEMVTEVRFAGISQGAGAKTNFVIRRLARLPIRFNVRITAPFRQLLDSAQSFYDPNRLIQRNLPALIQAQDEATRQKKAASPKQPNNPAIQHPESENKP